MTDQPCLPCKGKGRDGRTEATHAGLTKLRGACDICWELDGLVVAGDAGYCATCDAWLCRTCAGNWKRRIKAALIRRIRGGAQHA